MVTWSVSLALSSIDGGEMALFAEYGVGVE
jgi:hypothetical protein